MVTSVITPMSDGTMTPEKQAEHDAAMAAVAEEKASSLIAKNSQKPESDVSLTQVAVAPAERPAEIPEKFWDAAKGEVNVTALLKSQADGEAALRGQQVEPVKPAPVLDAEGKPVVPVVPAVVADQSAAVNAASAEFTEHGKLSDETYATLETTGLSKDMVNDYIEGQQAIVTTLQNAAFGEFGGEKTSYDAAVVWAQENLTDEELATIDVQITSRNSGIVKQGAAALAAKFAAGKDITPDVTISGGGNAASAGAGFKSSAEMQAAMSDPKYKTDPAFRAEVARKIDNASKANVPLFV